MTRRYLMCPPRFFAVEYSINPWMDPDRPMSRELAEEQWTKLHDTYLDLGHKVETIEPQPGLPDMVFAANSATVIDGRVLGANFRAPQRAPEADHYRRWFIENGYHDIVMPKKTNEAEGDFAWTGRFLLAGTGFRTDRAAHAELQELFGRPVISLDLVSPHYYHLDTALAVLSSDPADPQIAYYPPAFSAGSRAVLRQLFPDAVEATERDAVALGLNAVSDGYNVVVHEFAHVIDMRRGVTAGLETVDPASPRGRWLNALADEYERFADRVEGDEETFLDPYGAEALEEFFAVGSEAFFVAPQELEREEPRLYRLLAEFFRQDPAKHQ